jgi:hypothetical protein
MTPHPIWTTIAHWFIAIVGTAVVFAVSWLIGLSIHLSALEKHFVRKCDRFGRRK